MRDEPDAFEAFRVVRKAQVARTPGGTPFYQFFMEGGCHALAYAIQERIGGNLVVVTPGDQPSELIHAGVLKDGLVVDASGYSSTGYWYEMWA